MGGTGAGAGGQQGERGDSERIKRDKTLDNRKQKRYHGR